MSDSSRPHREAERGEPSAPESMLSQLYEELRQLAAFKMAQEAPGQTLQPTALVHEAWLRLSARNGPHFNDRAHFFRVAAEAMRRILIDRARRRQSVRHGGGMERADVEEVDIASPESDERLLQIHEALDRLGAEDPALAEVVKLRFFVGLSAAETAGVMGVSERTVERQWAYAKVWLLRALRQDG